MNKKFVISLLSTILTFLSVLGCDLSSNTAENKMDDIFNLEKKYMDNSNYKCLSKNEAIVKNSKIKLDANNTRSRSYSSRETTVLDSHNKTYSYCKSNWLILLQKNKRMLNLYFCCKKFTVYFWLNNWFYKFIYFISCYCKNLYRYNIFLFIIKCKFSFFIISLLMT